MNRRQGELDPKDLHRTPLQESSAGRALTKHDLALHFSSFLLFLNFICPKSFITYVNYIFLRLSYIYSSIDLFACVERRK
jgi:hypothetical protein